MNKGVLYEFISKQFADEKLNGLMFIGKIIGHAHRISKVIKRS